MIKLSFSIFFIILSFLSFSQYNIQKNDVITKYLGYDPVSSYPEDCLGDLPIYVGYDESKSELYLTFYDLVDGNNNSVFSGYEDNYLSFLIKCTDTYHQVSAKIPNNEYIDPNSNDHYIFVLKEIFDCTIYSGLIRVEDVTPCVFPGEYICGNSNLTLISSTDPNFTDYFPPANQANYIYIDDQECNTGNIDDVCALNTVLVGEIIEDDIVVKTKNITNDYFDELVLINNIGNIKFHITGFVGNNSSSQLITLFDSDWPNYNINEWEETLIDFAQFDEFYIETFLTLTDGSEIVCPDSEELELVNNSAVCDILTLLTNSINNGNLIFDFLEENNEDYLANALSEYDLSVTQAENIINQNVNYLNFILTYSNGADYITESYYFGNTSSVNIEDIWASFNDISSDNFLGTLLIEAIDYGGNVTECIINPITLSPEEELPLYDCDTEYELPNITNTTDIGNVSVGQIFFASGFAILTTNISNESNSYFGTGLMSIPFMDEPLIVEFSNVKINTELQLYEGTVFGKEDDPNNYPNFNVTGDTLEFGRDICLPPTLENDLNDDGTNVNTNFDENGFGPDGMHENGTLYDDGGFDVNGVHESGNIWNENGCSREGEKWELDEESQ